MTYALIKLFVSLDIAIEDALMKNLLHIIKLYLPE
jgi:hypothetical protein